VDSSAKNKQQSPRRLSRRMVCLNRGLIENLRIRYRR
jgi:hypothetical protein